MKSSSIITPINSTEKQILSTPDILLQFLNNNHNNQTNNLTVEQSKSNISSNSTDYDSAESHLDFELSHTKTTDDINDFQLTDNLNNNLNKNPLARSLTTSNIENNKNRPMRQKSFGKEFVPKFTISEPSPLLIIKRTPSKLNLPKEVGKPRVALSKKLTDATKYFGEYKKPEIPKPVIRPRNNSLTNKLEKQISLPAKTSINLFKEKVEGEKPKEPTFNFEPVDLDSKEIDDYIENLIANEDELMKPIEFKPPVEKEPEKMSSSIEDLLDALEIETGQDEHVDVVTDDKIDDLLNWIEELEHTPKERKVYRSISDAKYRNLETGLKKPAETNLISRLPKDNIVYFEKYLSGKTVDLPNDSDDDDDVNVSNAINKFKLSRSKTDVNCNQNRRSSDIDACAKVNIKKVLQKFESVDNDDTQKPAQIDKAYKRQSISSFKFNKFLESFEKGDFNESTQNKINPPPAKINPPPNKLNLAKIQSDLKNVKSTEKICKEFGNKQPQTKRMFSGQRANEMIQIKNEYSPNFNKVSPLRVRNKVSLDIKQEVPLHIQKETPSQLQKATSSQITKGSTPQTNQEPIMQTNKTAQIKKQVNVGQNGEASRNSKDKVELKDKNIKVAQPLSAKTEPFLNDEDSSCDENSSDNEKLSANNSSSAETSSNAETTSSAESSGEETSSNHGPPSNGKCASNNDRTDETSKIVRSVNDNKIVSRDKPTSNHDSSSSDEDSVNNDIRDVDGTCESGSEETASTSENAFDNKMPISEKSNLIEKGNDKSNGSSTVSEEESNTSSSATASESIHNRSASAEKPKKNSLTDDSSESIDNKISSVKRLRQDEDPSSSEELSNSNENDDMDSSSSEEESLNNEDSSREIGNKNNEHAVEIPRDQVESDEEEDDNSIGDYVNLTPCRRNIYENVDCGDNVKYESTRKYVRESNKTNTDPLNNPIYENVQNNIKSDDVSKVPDTYSPQVPRRLKKLLRKQKSFEEESNLLKLPEMSTKLKSADSSPIMSRKSYAPLPPQRKKSNTKNPMNLDENKVQIENVKLYNLPTPQTVNMPKDLIFNNNHNFDSKKYKIHKDNKECSIQ